MTASVWDKFLLLSWKNWIIQLRHPIQTFFELTIPIFICALLLLVKAMVTVQEIKETRYQPMSTTEIRNFSKLLYDVKYQGLIYSPDCPVYRRIVGNVSERLNFSQPVVGAPNSLELLKLAEDLQPFASVQFKDSRQVRVWILIFGNVSSQNQTNNFAGQAMDTLPIVIDYALRFPAELREGVGAFRENWKTNFRFSEKFVPGPREQYTDDGGVPPGYIQVT